MKGRYRRAMVVALGVVVVALVLLAMWLRPREPAYQGKRLTQWLDEYNQAGAWDKIGPVSEAIRAMGTNSLPFLLAHIKHRESAIKYKLTPLFRKLHFLKGPLYLRYPYRDTSILALYALGSNAAPILPELSKLFEDDPTYGRLSFLAIGTNSMPTLTKLC